MRVRDALALLIAASSLTGIGCGSDPEPPSSPEQVVVRVKEALADGDLGAFTQLVAPADRIHVSVALTRATGSAVMQAIEAGGGYELADDQRDVFEAHGIPPHAKWSELYGWLARVEHPVYVADSYALLRRAVGDESALDPVRSYVGDLSDLVIEGDGATGTVAGEAVRFTRIGTGWFLRFPEPSRGEVDPGEEE